MKSRLVGIWALGAALCLPGCAQAASGSASVQGLTFTLIDLDPNDGIAPGLVWNEALAGGDVSSVFGSLFSFDADGTWSVSFPDSGSDSVFDATSFSTPASASVGGVLAQIGNAGAGAQFQTAATGSADSAAAFAYGAFTLSPMTALSITGSLSASIHGPSSAGFALPAGTPANFSTLYAQSAAYAGVHLSPLSGLSSVPSFESITLNGENYTPSTDPLFSGASYDDSYLLVPFLLAMSNDSSGAVAGEFRADVFASGQQIANPPVSPVPEPQTWLLLGIGLLLIGLHRRRWAAFWTATQRALPGRLIQCG